MASRKAQKGQARQQRLAEEQARAERARRQRRLQTGLGGLLAVIVVAAVVVVIISGSGGSKSGTGSPVKVADTKGVTLPAPKNSDLTSAAKAAGCVAVDTPDAIARTDQNRTHVDPGTNVPYATNPPTYGPHYPSPASDGEYK